MGEGIREVGGLDQVKLRKGELQARLHRPEGEETHMTNGNAEALRKGANVAQGERVLSTLLGAAFLGVAASKRLSPGGVLAATLGTTLTYRGVTGRCRAYRALGINTAERGNLLRQGAQKLGARTRALVAASKEGNEVQRTITVQRSPESLYRMLFDSAVINRVVGDYAEVTGTGETKHWRVRTLAGHSLEWDERLVEARVGELLSWESLPNADLPTKGWVRFQKAPGDLGTEVTLHLEFSPPGGAPARSLIKLFGTVPDMLTDKALRRFKSLAETGEMPTVESNPAARNRGSFIEGWRTA